MTAKTYVSSQDGRGRSFQAPHLVQIEIFALVEKIRK